jgi:DNA polymerase V
MARESVKLASEGFNRPWWMKPGNKSQNYIIDWDGIAGVYRGV